MPGKDGQEAVIRKAYTMAGLPLDETPYVEVSNGLSRENMRNRAQFRSLVG